MDISDFSRDGEKVGCAEGRGGGLGRSPGDFGVVPRSPTQ